MMTKLLLGAAPLVITFAILATSSPVPATEGAEKAMSKEPTFKQIPLTEMQKYVTLHDGTEPAFDNEYWDHKEPGIYVDIHTGEPLFSSLDKFDSGTGWPSFTKPIYQTNITEHEDNKLWMARTEVRSKESDSHLGHVFPDGPKEAGGLRYCINSAALRFVHKDDLATEGYGEYKQLFEE